MTTFDPQTIGAFGTGASVVSGIMSVASTFYAAQGQQSMLEAQAELARINAASAESAARAAMLAGQREEQRLRLQTGMLRSRQRASLAANGVDLGEGSAARVLASTDILGEIDANQIAANAIGRAWGYRAQATQARIDANLTDARADAINPVASAAGSLLSSAGSVAASWYAMNKPVVPAGG